MVRVELALNKFAPMDLLNKINRLSVLTDGVAEESLSTELSDLQKKLSDEKLYIVVVGLFKRGKSTFINALLEKDILPVGVTPVTALITLIEYAKEPKAEIILKNRQTQFVPLNEISGFITEGENPNNSKEVEFVKAYTDSSILQFACLIDTPGLGSTYEHNTQTTLAFIHKIDAALFLLSADYPVSKVDLELLSELQKTAPEIWYILTKADLTTEFAMQKVIQHNQTVLAKELKLLPDEINFTIVTGTNKQDAGIQSLREKLIDLSKKDKAKLLQHSSLQQLRRITQKAILQLQFKVDAYLMPLQELENKSNQLTSSIQLMNDQKDEFESIITGKIKLLRQSIDEAVNAESIQLEKYVNEKTSTIETLQSDSLKAKQNEIDELILRCFNEVKSQWEQKAKEHFKNLLQQYSTRSQSFFSELSGQFSSYFGQNVDIISEQFDLNAYTSFYLSLDSGLPPLRLSKSIFSGLLPPSVQKRKLQKKWQEHYKEVIIRNTAAIIYDLSYKIQESFRKFNYDLNEKMKQLLSNMQKSIDDIIAGKAREEADKDAVFKDLTNRLEQLNLVQNELME
jgi:GTP-binding protein EngB required for normal cell division